MMRGNKSNKPFSLSALSCKRVHKTASECVLINIYIYQSTGERFEIISKSAGENQIVQKKLGFNVPGDGAF